MRATWVGLGAILLGGCFGPDEAGSASSEVKVVYNEVRLVDVECWDADHVAVRGRAVVRTDYQIVDIVGYVFDDPTTVAADPPAGATPLSYAPKFSTPLKTVFEFDGLIDMPATFPEQNRIVVWEQLIDPAGADYYARSNYNLDCP